MFYFPILHEENECILIVYMKFILTNMSCTIQMMCYILKDNVLFFWISIFSQIYKILV